MEKLKEMKETSVELEYKTSIINGVKKFYCPRCHKPLYDLLDGAKGIDLECNLHMERVGNVLKLNTW